MRTPLLLAAIGLLLAGPALAQEPTPPPPQEPPPSTPTPSGTWVPAPTPWPTVTPEATPWPTATPPQTGSWRPIGRAAPPPPPPPSYYQPTVPLFTLQGKVGVHTYSGDGWDAYDPYRSDFDSGAVEVGLAVRFLDIAPIRLEAVGELGYYGGSSCLDDNMGGCVNVSFGNAYGDVAGRAEVYAGQLAFYGQAGVGSYHSTERQEDPILGLDTSSSRTSPSVHVALGLAADFTPTVRFFGEWKYTGADGAFPGDPSNLDMGGSTLFLGAAVHFGLAPMPHR